MDMDLESRINQILGIAVSYIKVKDETEALCLVHHRWLDELISHKNVPSTFPLHDKLSDTEVKILLHQSSTTVVPPWSLVSVQLVLKRKGNVRRISWVQQNKQRKQQSSPENLTYSQLIHYVMETNYRNTWKEASTRYQGIEQQKQLKIAEYESYNQAVQDAIQKLYGCPIVRTGSSFQDTDFETSHLENCSVQTSSENGNCHPNIVSALCAVESEACFCIIQRHNAFSLQDCVRFSPAVLGSSSSRCLFVVYQLLHVIRTLHDLGLHLGEITLADVGIKQNLWISVTPRPWPYLWQEAEDFERKLGSRTENTQASYDDKLSITFSHSTKPYDIPCSIVQHSEVKGEDSLHYKCTNRAVDCPYCKKQSTEKVLFNKVEYLNTLVDHWVRGWLTNFDYLMELNKLAGREVGNPQYHAVLPWIMDFSIPVGGWRDLSKSKFRLTKGDTQLDLTYESAVSHSIYTSSSTRNFELVGSVSQVPHHVSDVLSDITYYVYMARRMPKSILCQHVRSKWVPGEYPSSVQRLQEWTPEECIPEFYTDPIIFYSIHDDLPDLGVPWWCDDPEDFIEKHRAALESDHVSEKLHHWIDLTFGYRLSGSAAVKSKNVFLPLVDQHTTIVNNGMVQLFTHPHPHKLTPSYYLSRTAPKTFRLPSQKLLFPAIAKKKTVADNTEKESGSDPKESGDEDSLSEGGSKVPRRLSLMRSKPSTPQFATEVSKGDFRPENQTVVLPKDYNPLAALNQLESLYSFTERTMNTVPSADKSQSEEEEKDRPHHRRSRDMKVLGCLIAEIVLSFRLRILPKKVPLDERYSFIQRQMKAYFHEVPRCFHYVLKLLLQVDLNEQETKPGEKISNGMFYYPSVTSDGLPPPSAHQLLQPLICILPFPSSFPIFYSYLCQINKYFSILNSTVALSVPSDTDDKEIQSSAEAVIILTAKTLPTLLPKLNPEGLDILAPYLQEIFEGSKTSLLASWHLFSVIAQELGPQQTVQKLLPTLTRLFDPDVPSQKHLKLYHRSYLLQLIVRLGLQTFLAHFTTVLIEAIGGYRDFFSGETQRMRGVDVPDIVTRKGSHLHSPELEQLVPDTLECDETGLVLDEPLSPYDDDSSQTESHPPEMKNNGNATDAEPEIFVLDNHSEEQESEQSKCYPEIHETFEDSGESTENGFSRYIKKELENWEPVDNLEQDESGKEQPDDDDATSGEADAQNQTLLPKLESEDKISAYSSSVPNLPSTFCHWPPEEAQGDDKKTPPSESFEVEGLISSEPKEVTPTKKLTPCLRITDSLQDKPRPLPPQYNISDVAAESVIWLAHRLGPVLTAKYLTRNLVRMLTLCYVGPEQLTSVEKLGKEDIQSQNLTISKKWVLGDESASKVLECLSATAALYGEHFIILQYLPHVADLVSSVTKVSLCKRRLTETLEAGLIGAMALVVHIIPYLSDSTLMDQLQDVIIKDIIYPVVRLVSSLRITFPRGVQSRTIVTHKLIDSLYMLGLRIGFEMTRKYLSLVLQRFFASFDRAYENHENNDKLELSTSNTFLFGGTPQSAEDYLEIKKNSQTNEYTIGTPVRISNLIIGSKTSIDSLSPPTKEEKPTTSDTLNLQTPNTKGEKSSPSNPIRAKALEEIKQVFTPELAYLSYIPFCKLAGGIHMEQTLKNDELIRHLCMTYDNEISNEASGLHSSDETEKLSKSHQRMPSLGLEEGIASGEFGKNVAIVGNRIDIQLGEESHLVVGGEKLVTSAMSENTRTAEMPKFDISMIMKKMDNNQRHLKGNWLAYWEHEIGRSDKDFKFNFKQIKLQAFTGHTGGVRAIEILDNENSFLTGSKDKTVKLWALRSCGDGNTLSSCQWTYLHHKKSVFSVTFLESLRLVGSCDSTVHIWDPFVGTCLKQLDSSKATPVTVLSAMPAPSTTLLAATSNSTIRCLDTRTCSYMHEFKVSLGPAGVIRTMAVSPNGNWLAVGHSSGVLSVLDVRTGMLFGSWVAHENEVLQVKAFNSKYFVSSSLDHSLTVWSAEDTKTKCYLRGSSEPVTCLNFYKSEVITGTTANRVGIYSSLNSQASLSSTRLRSDTFKGVLTAMAVLPLNRLLLLGADNGLVSLFC
ncbi:WD repeat-containing protein 81-like isoform X1 [Limulus polyphemus]|uniref:WD repeat-containing protein 81-like isoform X1 n=1 Tax=Limulus polyphemus TaxID=6850 RepID=A0ABM1SSB7_LIMPO|nr:WD repeat-containing protein 81-like isoform X1 [Limulus polyphemus]